MTDESDRMDRARRIREMREGDRVSPDRSADGDEADSDEVESDEAATTEGESDHQRMDGDDGETGSETAVASRVDDPGVDDPGVDDPGVDRDRRISPDEDGSGDVTSADGESIGSVEAAETGTTDDDGGTLRIPGADVGDVEVDPGELAREAGLETVDGDETDEAGVGTGQFAGFEGDVDGSRAGPGAPSGSRRTQTRSSAAETRVLEFDLGTERYCLDIEHVEEIVKRETVTRVPNTPEFVEGVVDLRGQITTILDPKNLLDIDADGPEELLVVFDPDEFEDQGAIGWLVDDVNQVTPVTDDEVSDSPVDQEHVRGVVERDGDFVIWTTPDIAFDGTTG